MGILSETDIQKLYTARTIDAEKRDFGHVLIMGGSYGMIGAVCMATKAALRCGAGLVSVLAPECGYVILQTSVPEAMVLETSDEKYLEYLPDVSGFSVLAVGPGLGKEKSTIAFMDTLLHLNRSMVIDADALNIIAMQQWQHRIPKGSVITPHKREFARLFGETTAHNKLQLEKAMELGIYIVLKEPRTSVAFPNGKIYYNSTGNAGMAKGGSGDVLTGIIAGLHGRLDDTEKAVLMGIFLHGLAGDISAARFHTESMLPTDIIRCLPAAFMKLWPE